MHPHEGGSGKKRPYLPMKTCCAPLGVWDMRGEVPIVWKRVELVGT